jgi:hypothetical protein
VIYFIALEIKQMRGLYRQIGSFKEVLEEYISFWNMFDVFRILTLGTYFALEFENFGDSVYSSMSAILILVSWVCILD